MRESIKRNRGLLLRLLGALAGGLAIASTSYLCAYYESRWIFWNHTMEGYSWSKVRLAMREIDEYRKEKGRLPANLDELHKGAWIDAWDRPLHYELEGDRYRLYSYGRDGESGGVGPDADIFSDRQPEAPTLYQFTFEMHAEGVHCGCILAGVFAGLVCLLQSRKHGWDTFFLRLGVTAIGAFLAAIAMSALHVPTGH